MTARRSFFRSLTIRSALFSVITLAATAGCPTGDVGAPCNHGEASPPSTKLVTFPAVSCSDLICIYGDDERAPDLTCNVDADCNLDGVPRFECQAGNRCGLSFDYFLERSMCSKRCSSDSDCENSGITTDKKPINDEITRCNSGFRCAVVQDLGEFCCEKLCVCNDDIADADLDDLEMTCQQKFETTGRAVACGCQVDSECAAGETCTDGNCFPV